MNANSTLQAIDPILNIKQVMEVVGYSKSQIYRLIDGGSFPDRVRLGPGRVGWRRSMIVGWIDSRPCGSTSPKITKPGSRPQQGA